MPSKVSFKDRARFAFGRAKGVPIEADIGPYLKTVRAASSMDHGGLGRETLASMADRLRDASPASAGDSGAEPAALALAREACRLGLRLEPFQEQLVAAAAMHAGMTVQMQTGEGKTLAAALAASMGAMAGRRVHILTANDYLAKRDAEWMGPLYRALGISASSIGGSSSKEERRAAYRSDVCYLTARELGFDFLRDGLAYRAEDAVQEPFMGAIVDEADFILIDEARVPLVIAGTMEGDGIDLAAVDEAAGRLVAGQDFKIDPEGRNVGLTLAGDRKLNAWIAGADARSDLPPQAKARAFAALHARHLLQRDRDYVVKGGSVKLVDGFTGRIAERRQWPWGIQAALEAKEGLAIGPEGRIYASITVQSLIGLYPRLAAMTATAVPAAQELADVYGLRTLVIPPALSSRRIDRPDAVFWDRRSRDEAVAEEIATAKASGRPVLVGTPDVAASERLAAALAAKGVTCVVLNAKNDEEEARLIAAAGQTGAVTISTNMAGRGTDIRLGADPRLIGLGGLLVIGTSRHESRRVDDQLRGRSGRQGEPGESRFFVSLEDELFTRFGIRAFLPKPYRGGQPGSGPIQDPAVARELTSAQSVIEAQNARIRSILMERSRLVEYDRRYARQLRDAALREGRLPEEVEARLAESHSPEAIESSRPALVQAFLARLDAAWAEHLALVEDFKEGLGLVRLGGRDPGREFIRLAGDAFEKALAELAASTILDCDDLISGKDPGAGREPPPDKPSSTWTYIVDDSATPGFDPGIVSGAAALALGHLALPAFILERAVKALFARRKKKKEGA